MLSDKKQELISKLELYKSLSDKLNDNIQRYSELDYCLNLIIHFNEFIKIKGY